MECRQPDAAADEAAAAAQRARAQPPTYAGLQRQLSFFLIFLIFNFLFFLFILDSFLF